MSSAPNLDGYVTFFLAQAENALHAASTSILNELLQQTDW